MGHTFSKTLCLISLSTIIGLAGCASNNEALMLAERNKQWFCVPHDSKEWQCTKDDTTFKKLATPKHISAESQWTVGKKIPQKSNTKEATLGASDEGEGLEELPTIEASSNSGQPLTLSVASNTDTEPSSAAPSNPPVTHESNNDHDRSHPSPLDISPWIVQLAAYSTPDAAERFAQSLGEGQIFKTQVKGKDYFTVVLVGFDSKLDAEEVAANLKKRQLGVSPWVRTGASFEKSLEN